MLNKKYYCIVLLLLSIGTKAHTLIVELCGAAVLLTIANILDNPAKKPPVATPEIPLALRNTEYFEDAIFSIQNHNYDLALTFHAYYRYPAFLAALERCCPRFDDYIHELRLHLDNDYEKRKVDGFTHYKQGSLFNNYIRRYNNSDYYQFYELIKKLDTHVMHKKSLTCKALALYVQAEPVLHSA